MKRTLANSVFVFVSLGSITIAASGCAAKAEASRPLLSRAPIAIVVEPARAPAPHALYIGPGVVSAAHTYRLGFEVSGRVTSVNADVGDRVAAGDTLATIDDTAFAEDVATARARFAAAAATAARATNGARPQERAQARDEVSAAHATVARARAAFELARANDARAQQLLVSGDIARQSADTTHATFVDAQAQLRSASAQFAAAEANAQLIDAGPRTEDRAIASAEAAAARASVDLASTTLAKTRLSAPADAYVLARTIERGNIAEPGTVAFTLTDAGAPDIIVAVPELLVGNIALGTSARITLDARTTIGHVTRIEPAADDATHTTQIRLRAPGFDMRPGAIATVALAPERTRGSSVPLGAILTLHGRTFIATYDAARSTVERRSVRVISNEDDRANIGGIAPGTPVVVMGQQRVEPGDAVRVVSGS